MTAHGVRTTYDLTTFTWRDVADVVHLQRLLWRGGAVGNTAYLNWKYRLNPYLDERYVVLAWHGGALAGMAGAFGAAWDGNGASRLMLPCLTDTVIEPEHRGGPLFRTLVDEIVRRLEVDKVPWLLDFGDQPAAPALQMSGWKAIGPWPLALRRGSPASSSLASPRRSVHGGRLSGERIECVDADRFLEAVDRRLAFEPRVKLHHVQDVEYFAWRSRNPLAHYTYLIAGSGTVAGHAILHRPRANGVAQTRIVACEAEATAVWADLLVATGWHHAGDHVISGRDLSDDKLEALLGLGFELRRPTGRVVRDQDLPNLLVRPITPGRADSIGGLDYPSAWDLRGVCGRSWS